MSVIDKCVVESQYAPNAETGIYAPGTGVRGTLLKFTATNVTGTAATITIKLIPAGGSASAENTITLTKSVEPGGYYAFPELIGHTLNPGDSLSVIAGTASALVIRCTAREVS